MAGGAWRARARELGANPGLNWCGAWPPRAGLPGRIGCVSGAFELPRESRGKRRTPLDVRLGALAETQYGVVTFDQLRRLGFSSDQVERRIQLGRLHRLHRGVYAVGHRHLPNEALFIAAVLALGSKAVLSHKAAAALWDFAPEEWSFMGEASHLIDVTIPRRVRQRPGLRIHPVRTLEMADTTLRKGIPVTTPVRTLRDLADTATSDSTLRRLLHEAEVQERVSIHQLRTYLQNGSNRNGAPRLKALIAPGPTPTRSELEDRTVELLGRDRLPRPRTNARVPDVPAAGTVDMLFETQRLVIECDGDRYHKTAFKRASDARKQAALEAAGYRVIRLTWDDVNDEPEQTLARVRNALALDTPAQQPA